MKPAKNAPARAPSSAGAASFSLGLAAAAIALAIWLLRDTLTFETLRENRETLLAWRDANYLSPPPATWRSTSR
jgi:hypothetical protein